MHDVLVLRLEAQPDPRERAAGADRAGEAVDPAVHLRPDLVARWCRYGRGGWRYCRTGWPRARWRSPRRCGATCARNGRGSNRRGGHEHQFGAQRAQRIHLLAALRLGHDDDRLVALRIADQREADAGIAGGALDDRAAGLRSCPCASASSTMNSAARSFTEAPGLANSHLPKMSQPVASLGPFSRTSGVLPMSASVSGAVYIAPR